MRGRDDKMGGKVLYGGEQGATHLDQSFLAATAKGEIQPSCDSWYP